MSLQTLIHLFRQNYNLLRFSPPEHTRLLHTSASRWGLEEFFDLPENWGETTVKSGTTQTESRPKKLQFTYSSSSTSTFVVCLNSQRFSMDSQTA